MYQPQTIVEAACALRRGEVTSQHLVTSALQRIDHLDAQVNAWVIVDAAGAAQAAERAAEELAAGRDRGPLHGIPLGVKDIVDVAGMPTRAGSRLTDPCAANADATVVERLRAAGAIILGKTVTTEFACFDPSPTRNPWNLEHTPGGSSSGSAAAVALGMCLGAIASQTGGSITRPASYCGVAGCKPTFGRTSRAGVVPVSFSLDHVGVMARTAADCDLLLQTIAGPDPRDPLAVARDDQLGPPEVALDAPSLGVIEQYFMQHADAEVAELTRRALEVLRAGGAHLTEVPLPEGFANVHMMHRRIMARDVADFHRSKFAAPRQEYGPNMATLIAEGLAISTTQYSEALRHQAVFRSAVGRALAGVDALVTPATPTAAPASLATTGDPRFNSPWSHAGVPTISIPIALTSAGLPVSLQLIGPAWSEARLLAIGEWCERRLAFRASPPMAQL